MSSPSPDQTPSKREQQTPKDEFFVGYLPMPKKLTRFHRLVVPLGGLRLLRGAQAVIGTRRGRHEARRAGEARSGE